MPGFEVKLIVDSWGRNLINEHGVTKKRGGADFWSAQCAQVLYLEAASSPALRQLGRIF